MLSQIQIAQLKNQLLNEQSEWEQWLKHNQHFGKENAMSEQLGELSLYDNHPGDVGSEMYEREKDIALNEQASQHLDEVQQALQRMEEGLYGVCEECGEFIPYERLEALPTTRYCKEHSPEKHVSQNRPIEELIEYPPFGRTDLDEEDAVVFDGEDAWQIVESWGNSNTPAFAEDPEVNDYNGMYIEADELDGFVEGIESFAVSNLHGYYTGIIRNDQYKQVMNTEEYDILEQDEFF